MLAKFGGHQKATLLIEPLLLKCPGQKKPAQFALVVVKHAHAAKGVLDKRRPLEPRHHHKAVVQPPRGDGAIGEGVPKP